MAGEPFLTVKDVAARCRVHVSTVKRWIRDGLLPAFRPQVGHGSSPHLVSPQDFNAFVQARKDKPRKESPR